MTVPSRRRGLLALVHIARKELALDDGSYRAVLRRVTGATSSADCTEPQLSRLIDEFRRLGWTGDGRSAGADGRPRASDPQARMARALWLSLYRLCEIDDASEKALAAFGKRAGATRDALQWYGVEDFTKLIEALKDRCARAGFEIPDAAARREMEAWRRGAGLKPAGHGFAANVCLIELLWQRLIDAGALRTGKTARLDTWLRTYGVSAAYYLAPADAMDAIRRLGGWLRKVRPAGQVDDDG